MRKIIYFFSIFVLLMSFGCENNDDQILIVDDTPIVDQKKEYRILSLGDSYRLAKAFVKRVDFLNS